MRPRILLTLVLHLLVVRLFRCQSPASAGGTEVGNPCVAGCVVMSGGQAAHGAEVFLVPYDYNPLEDTVVHSTRTNEAGEYRLDDIDPGLYSLNAREAPSGMRIAYTLVDVRLGQDAERRTDTLRAPGTVVAVIADTAYQEPMAVYVPGSDVYVHVEQPCSLALPVPAGRIDIVSYDTLGGRVIESGPNYRQVPVVSGDTITIVGHAITTPAKPEGADTAFAGDFHTYRTHGAASSMGHPVEYRFGRLHYTADATWDTVTPTAWGPDSVRISWPYAGRFKVRAQARSVLDTVYMSTWSPYRTILVQ